MGFPYQCLHYFFIYGFYYCLLLLSFPLMSHRLYEGMRLSADLIDEHLERFGHKEAVMDVNSLSLCQLDPG